MVAYPSDDKKFVKAFRFLNFLDPDFNMLSPVRINAWVATISTGGQLLDSYLTKHAHVVQTGLSLVWMALAHGFHQADKNNRAKNEALTKGTG